MQKALIVDDSPAELVNLRNILTDAGWSSVTASNGNEAIRKAVDERPSVIFCDILMPEMDGYQTCRELQARPETRGIPLVFVSSKNQKADQLWARMLGAKDLIGKPYTASQVLTALRAYA